MDLGFYTKEVTNKEYEDQIFREVTKTKKQKIKDSKKSKSNLPMIGGGINDVF